MADRDETMRGLPIKTTESNAKRNPLVTVADDAAEDMLAYAGHFGLTPVTRTMLAANGYRPSSPGNLIGNCTVVPYRVGAVQPAAFAQAARSESIIKSRLIGTTSRLVDNSI